MQLIKLASNYWIPKAVFSLLILCLITSVVYNAWETSPFLKYPVLFVLSIIGIALVFKKVKKSWAIYFNSEEMMLKRNAVERVIPLKNIDSIKYVPGHTSILGLTYRSYKVEFENERNKTETVNFMVSDLNSEIESFIELVERQKKY